jgi:nicotinamide mononucleotide (NMN) deamidase PncC
VYVGVAVGGRILAVPGWFEGDRAAVRAAAVGLALDSLLVALAQE